MKHDHKADAEALRSIGAEEPTMPEQEQPKLCPFCGSDPICEDEGGLMSNVVRCSNMDCNPKPVVRRPTDWEAIAAWNTRHEPDPATDRSQP